MAARRAQQLAARKETMAEDEEEESGPEVGAASASGLAALGADPEDMAFARVRLPRAEVRAVFRPDVELGEHMAWSHVRRCARTPCLWPVLLLLYPVAVGCARNGAKLVHETFYVATDEGVVTIVNDFERRMHECMSPKVVSELIPWEDIEDITERDANMGAPGVLFRLTPEAQRRTNNMAEVWYVCDAAASAKLLRGFLRFYRTPRHGHANASRDKHESLDGQLTGVPRERTVFVASRRCPDDLRLIMVHDEMELKALKAIALYALDWDELESPRVRLTCRETGASVSSPRDTYEEQVLLVEVLD